MHTLRNKSVFFETYGCTFNFADTEKLKEIAVRQGCTIADAPESADAVAVNTCTVVSQTERAMIKAVTEFPDKDIYVTGCMPPVQADLLRSVRPDVHLIMPEEIYAESDRYGAIIEDGTGVVQTGTGCLGNCAYCITKKARGHLKSFAPEKIVAETKRLVEKGAKEIQLTGQDISAWGRDIGMNLGDLLRQINDIDGDFAVRCGMMNPMTVWPHLDEIIEGFALPKIYAFIHLPVQSGSNEVLRTMNRGYTAERYCEIVDAFRRKIPDARICTDFIVGYPTETEELFEETLALLNRVRPTKVNITRFSLREGTKACEYYDMPDWIKKNRSRKLTLAVNDIYDSNNESMIGTLRDAAVTECRKSGTAVLRDKSYNNIVVMEPLPIGMKLKVRITGHRRHYLIAEPAEKS